MMRTLLKMRMTKLMIRMMSVMALMVVLAVM